MNNPEYQRGYRAGRRKTETEEAEAQKRNAEAWGEFTRRRHEVMCAALQGLIACTRSWNMDGKPVDKLDLYVDLAQKFARAAVPAP